MKVYVVLFHNRPCSHSSSRSYWHALIMETRHSLDSRISHSVDCSRPPTLPLVWSLYSYSSHLVIASYFSFLPSHFIYMERMLLLMSRKFDHVTPFLRELYVHWLHFPKRIVNKPAMLVFKCLTGLAPSHISPANFVVWLTPRVDSGRARRRQRNSSSHESVVQPSEVALSRSRLRMHGTSSVTSTSSSAVEVSLEKSCSRDATMLTYFELFSRSHRPTRLNSTKLFCWVESGDVIPLKTQLD